MMLVMLKPLHIMSCLLAILLTIILTFILSLKIKNSNHIKELENVLNIALRKYTAVYELLYGFA